MFASTTISASICLVYNLTMKLVKTTWTVLHLNKKKKILFSIKPSGLPDWLFPGLSSRSQSHPP